MHNNVKKMVLAGLFIALEIITTRFLSIQTPIIRISMDFIPVALSAVMLGPFSAGIAAAIADILGMLIFSKGAAYFPGFTLSAFMSGFLYGIMLYKKKVTLTRSFLAVLSVTICTSIVLNTIWLVIITRNGAIAILSARILKDAVMLPVQAFMICYISKALEAAVTHSLSIRA
ncbi:MAG TPA: folate family ECF transporter S component [Ruminiclostridium sp.]|nr:folate family ECF transporter S component [Ruminiclostridium sp.]